ncbi:MULTISPECIES: hypothetical protein [Actinomyces]|uniref:Uncharacterized protein n=1 Tax=Actinomyces respiraculi TaxID=2744574 RepID=A0A7T0LJ81_9ACTO|nr:MULTISPECIES: hypothetical protein [Actinomyces]QPL04769.1 hypothetical protein ID810_08295 [Actinomyces respiraculi]
MLRCLIEATSSMCPLTQDTGISIATAYRYLDEALDVVSQHTPDLIDTQAIWWRPVSPTCVWTAP